MTYTIADDFSYIDISSELINTWLDDSPNPDYTIELILNYNCSGEDVTEMEYDMDGLEAFVAEPYLRLSAEYFDMTDVLSDGIFSIKVKVTQDDGSYESDSVCVFVDQETKCCLIEYMADNLDDCKAISLYLPLTFVNTCSDCACADACLIFAELQELLGLETSTSVTNGCGCK